MPKIEVPDSIADEVKALVQREKDKAAKLARIAEIDAQLEPLQAERAELMREIGGALTSPRRGRRSSNIVTEDDVLAAVRDGATTNTEIAERLNVSTPTATARVNTLLKGGKLKTEGERRGRKLLLA
jgi:predicted HTH transcriptional regulator